MTQPASIRDPARRSKLGLALAGGGFRASLFHLGVLRRLAELDVLRSIEVLSTVSGGSIIGALYVLLLKRELEKSPDGNLSHEGYIRLVDELDRILVRGIRRNLRTLLFINPFGLLRVMLTHDSLSRRMSRLYERYLFETVVQQLDGYGERSRLERLLRPGRVPLSAIHIRPGGKPIREEVALYNAKRLRDGGSVLTSLVLNATSLNSGARFWFSGAEVGDGHLGAFRPGEVRELLDRKALVQEREAGELESVLSDGTAASFPLASSRDAVRSVSLGLWWRRRKEEDAGPALGWEDLWRVPDFPGRLPDAELGSLRRAKLAAWYLREGLDPRRQGGIVTGGQTGFQHRQRFYGALAEIDPELTAALLVAANKAPPMEEMLLDFVLELYWLRTGERVARDFERDWSGLTLADAVGASACFPPVFPPFTVLGLYDDAFVARLGLTDGGVFDNIGITALVEEGCTQVIASDTGGLFHEEPAAPEGYLGLVLRIPDILMRALGSFQKQGLRERRRVSRALDAIVEERHARGGPSAGVAAPRRLEALAYFHIDSPALDPLDGGPVVELGTDARDVALLRTDLDAFGEVEVAALANHGYATADRYLRRYLRDVVGDAPERRPPDPPKPRVRGQRVERILRIGRSRFFRALKLGTSVAVTGMVGAILVAAVAVLVYGVSLADLGSAAGTIVVWWGRILASLLPDAALTALTWLATGLSTVFSSSSGLAALLIGGLALVLWRVSLVPNGQTGRQPSNVKLRRLRRASAARIWSWKGNLLWLVLALPLLIAGLSFVLFGLSWLLFSRPFLAATRIRRADLDSGQTRQPVHAPAVATVTRPNK